MGRGQLQANSFPSIDVIQAWGCMSPDSFLPLQFLWDVYTFSPSSSLLSLAVGDRHFLKYKVRGFFQLIKSSLVAPGLSETLKDFEAGCVQSHFIRMPTPSTPSSNNLTLL